MTDRRSVRKAAILRIELRLPTIAALFDTPDLTPFSPEFHPYSYTSGMEYLADRLYADRRFKEVEATFVVPRDEFSSTVHESVHAAIRRYAATKIEATNIKARADAIRGRRAMFLGVAALVILLLIASWVSDATGGGFAPDTVVTGLEIGAWVALWFPIEKLFWGAWTHRNDRLVYGRLRDMRFTITTDGEHQ